MIFCRPFAVLFGFLLPKVVGDDLSSTAVRSP